MRFAEPAQICLRNRQCRGDGIEDRRLGLEAGDADAASLNESARFLVNELAVEFDEPFNDDPSERNASGRVLGSFELVKPIVL